MPLTTIPTVKCDCERQSPEGSAAADNGQPGTERSVSKQKPEEVFAGGIPLALTGHFMDPAPRLNGFVLCAVSPGFATALFQPPRG
jgi:hypothetical protein